MTEDWTVHGGGLPQYTAEGGPSNLPKKEKTHKAALPYQRHVKESGGPKQGYTISTITPLKSKGIHM